MTRTCQSMSDLGDCECCGAEPAVGVAAIPGAPMSIAWGRKCLCNGARPLWVANYDISQAVPPFDPDWRHVADWYRQQTVYLSGEYVQIDQLELEVRDCDHTKVDPEHIAPDGSCPLCFGGRFVALSGVCRGTN